MSQQRDRNNQPLYRHDVCLALGTVRGTIQAKYLGPTRWGDIIQTVDGARRAANSQDALIQIPGWPVHGSWPAHKLLKISGERPEVAVDETREVADAG